MPITWRNVAPPDFSGAGRLMESSQRMLDSGFGQFKNIIDTQQSLDKENVINERKYNSNQFLNQLHSRFKTPEELDAAIKSGAVDQLQQSFGPNIDSDAVRGAAQNLLAQRYQQVAAANAFGDQKIDREQAPIRDQIASYLNSGDKLLIAQGKALLDKHNLRNEAPLYAQLNNGEYQLVTRERDTEEFGMKKRKFNDDLATNSAQRAAAADSRALNKLTRESMIDEKRFRNEERSIQLGLRLEDAASKLRKEKGSLMDNGLTSEDGINNVKGALATFKDPEHQDIARRTVAELSKIPGMTDTVVAHALSGLEAPGWLNTDRGLVSDAVGRAKAMMESADYKAKLASNSERKALIDTKIADLLALDPSQKATTTPAKSASVTPAKEPEPEDIDVRPVAKSPNSIVTPWHVKNNFGNPVITTAPPPKAIEAAAKKSIDAQVKAETTARNRGDIMDYSPEVKVHMAKQQAAKAAAELRENQAKLKKEMEKELKKAKNLQ